MEVKTKFQLFLTGECQTFLGYFGFKKGQKIANFRANLVEFRVEKGYFLFAAHCYIWAFFGY